MGRTNTISLIMNIIFTCIVGQLGLSGLGIFINCFSSLLICFSDNTLFLLLFLFLLFYSHLQTEKYLISAIKSLWTRYSDFRGLLLVTIWCTCQRLNTDQVPNIYIFLVLDRCLKSLSTYYVTINKVCLSGIIHRFFFNL